MFTLNHSRLDTLRGDLEERVLDLLSLRPYSLLELAEATRVLHVGLLPLPRLESLFAVQRCGLTPTDLLHATGRFVRWNAAASTRMVGLAAGLDGISPETLLTDLLRRVVRQLTMDVIHHQLAPAAPHTSRETCPTCDRMLENLLDGGGHAFAVRFELRRPNHWRGCAHRPFSARGCAGPGRARRGAGLSRCGQCGRRHCQPGQHQTAGGH